MKTDYKTMCNCDHIKNAVDQAIEECKSISKDEISGLIRQIQLRDKEYSALVEKYRTQRGLYIEQILQSSEYQLSQSQSALSGSNKAEVELSEKAYDLTSTQLVRTQEEKDMWKELCEKLLKEIDAARGVSPVQEEARKQLKAARIMQDIQKYGNG